jgi:hypothetical protein
MAARLTVTLPNGTKIEGESASEVAEAAAALQRLSEPKPLSQSDAVIKNILRTNRNVDLFTPDRNGFDVKRATLEFLQAIKVAGPQGVGGKEIQTILHADHPKGVGGRMVRVNGYLRRLGFHSTEEIFDNPKDRKLNARIWVPKEKIDAAIDAARKAVK